MHQGSKSCCRFKQLKEKGLPVWNHLPRCSPCWLASHRNTFWKTHQLELFRAVTYTEWDHLNSLLLCQISCKSVQIKIMAFGWRCFPFSPCSFFIFPEPPPPQPSPRSSAILHFSHSSPFVTRRSASTGPMHQAVTRAESHSLWQTSI